MALRNDGFSALNQFITYKGSPPHELWRPGRQKWTIVKHRPKAQTWGASTHTSAKVRHLIKAQYVGLHLSGYKVRVTVWACGLRAHTAITVDPALLPERKCWTCSKFEQASQSKVAK